LGHETTSPSAAKNLTRVEAEIASKGDGVDASAYLENMLPVVRANWYRLISRNNAGVKGGVSTLSFEISSDGSLGPTRTEGASGNGTLDQLALKAVQSSVPFPTFSKGLDGENLKIRCHFYYNLDESKPAGNKAVMSVGTDGGTALGQPAGVREGGIPGNVIRSCSSDGGEGKDNCITPPQVILSNAPVATSLEVDNAKYDGVVTLSLVVQTNGKPDNIQVVKSLGPSLDKKAIDAVNGWKFRPAMKGGSPVVVQIMVEVKFARYER
jgi:TonB family protein